MKLGLFFALYMDSGTIEELEERVEFLFLMMSDLEEGKALHKNHDLNQISPENDFAKRAGMILLTLAAKFPVEQVKDVSVISYQTSWLVSNAKFY